MERNVKLSEAKKKLIASLDYKTQESILALPTDAADDNKRKKRVEHTYEGILSQPQAIKDTLIIIQDPVHEIVKQLCQHKIKRVYLVGCGDSWFTNISVRFLFEAVLNIPCEAIQSLEYAHYYFKPTDKHTAVIGVTAGGNTPRTIEALAIGRAAGAFTIGITNTADAVISQETHMNIVIPVKRIGWPTQSSTSGIATLALLALEWAKSLGVKYENYEFILTGLCQLPSIIQEIINTTDEQMANIAEEIHSAPIYLFAGAGPGFGAASFGAAKVKELCPIHAISMPLEEYHHYRTQKPYDPIFLVAPPSPSNQRVTDTLNESSRFQGISIVLIEKGSQAIDSSADYTILVPETNKYLTAIPYSIPLQLFAYHLAKAKFRHNEGYPGITQDCSHQ